MDLRPPRPLRPDPGARAARAARPVAPVALALAALAALAPAAAQVLPDGVAAPPAWTCPAPDRPPPAPMDEAERLERERRARYRAVFPAYADAAPPEPDAALVMPVDGLRVAQVADTWGAARSEGRTHEGQDLFAPRGTPVRSATPGLVYRIGPTRRGGRTVTIVAGGGRRVYYAHLEGYAEGLREGQRVEIGTLLGFVGDSGNAAGTPPHLHLGVYASVDDACSWDALNPYPLLRDR